MVVVVYLWSFVICHLGRAIRHWPNRQRRCPGESWSSISPEVGYHCCQRPKKDKTGWKIGRVLRWLIDGICGAGKVNVGMEDEPQRPTEPGLFSQHVSPVARRGKRVPHWCQDPLVVLHFPTLWELVLHKLHKAYRVGLFYRYVPLLLSISNGWQKGNSCKATNTRHCIPTKLCESFVSLVLLLDEQRCLSFLDTFTGTWCEWWVYQRVIIRTVIGLDDRLQLMHHLSWFS